MTDTLVTKIIGLIPQCNAETVAVPIESLTIIARTDKQCAQRMDGQVISAILQVYGQYHQDAMLQSDILALIKLLGRVDDTTAFRQLVLPQIL